jgi:8-oxo-dGTP diphosphatase
MVERVDSAVKVVLWRDGEFLVIRTDAEGEDPRWGIPGGRIEYGETPREALRREVREETSLEVEDLQVCGIFDFYYRETQIVPVIF